MSERATDKWSGKTYGNGWMHKMLIKFLRCVDIRFFYAIVALFVAPVCMIVNPGGKIIYHYFRKRRGKHPMQALWATYRNHLVFGEIVVDRFAMFADKKFKIEIEGYENFDRLSKGTEGFVQLSAHIGNYELAGYSLVAKDKMFNALVFDGEKASVMENRNRLFANTNIKMIAINANMSYLFEIDEALANGEIVSIPADRIFGSSKNLQIPFLGAEAKFPQGPFRVATMRELDVIAVNVMKVASDKYKIYVTPLSYDKEATKKEQIRQLSTAYVGELERMLELYPHQWFNYFEFWQQ